MTKLPANKIMADYEHLGANPNAKLQTSGAMPPQPLSGKCNTITEKITKSGPLTITHAKNHMKEYPGKENIPVSTILLMIGKKCPPTLPYLLLNSLRPVSHVLILLACLSLVRSPIALL